MEAPTDTALFIGAGFSAAAGLPSTKGIGERFLNLRNTQDTPKYAQKEITRHLSAFWKLAFSHRQNRNREPTFEDHFTTLDLAANAGHGLGPNLPPAHLRATRRLSLHRVFELISNLEEKAWLRSLFSEISAPGSNAIICTNLDLVLERYLASISVDIDYGIPLTPLHVTNSG